MTFGAGDGVGNPEDRDPEAVRMDVKNNLVSLEMARDVYKVVLDPNTCDIIQEATQKLRAKGKIRDWRYYLENYIIMISETKIDNVCVFDTNIFDFPEPNHQSKVKTEKR